MWRFRIKGTILSLLWVTQDKVTCWKNFYQKLKHFLQWPSFSQCHYFSPAWTFKNAIMRRDGSLWGGSINNNKTKRHALACTAGCLKQIHKYMCKHEEGVFQANKWQKLSRIQTWIQIVADEYTSGFLIRGVNTFLKPSSYITLVGFDLTTRSSSLLGGRRRRYH
jgi:hypothetical protein